MLSQNPNHVVVLALYAGTLASTDRLEEAREKLKKAKEINPNAIDVIRFEHVLESRFGGTIVKQEETLEAVMNSSLDEPSKLIMMITTEYYRKNYSKACKLAHQAYLLDPANPETLETYKGIKKVVAFNRLIDMITIEMDRKNYLKA